MRFGELISTLSKMRCPGIAIAVLAAVVRTTCLASTEECAAVTGSPRRPARIALAEMRSRMSCSKYFATTFPCVSTRYVPARNPILRAFRLHRFVQDSICADDSRIGIRQQRERDLLAGRKVSQNGH